MIEVQNVHKIYPASKGGEEVYAVNDVSFRCEPGRVFALLGPNGSGKTTLLRMISTLMKPQQGSISVADHDVSANGEYVRSKIGFLTGSAGLHEKLSARETLRYFGTLHGLNKSLLELRVAELIEQFELTEFIDRPTGKLSMGQKQRVMLARTLVHDPDVVVFDEATTGLDVLAAKSLMDIIRSCREDGKTVLFSTHIMGEVSMLADDVLILHKGRQIFKGTMDDFRAGQQSASIEDEFVRLLENAEKLHKEAVV